MRVGLPIAFGRLLWRSRREAAYRRRWHERLGLPRGLPTGGVWLHAVSVGEVNAAAPLIEALLARYPQLPLTVTTITPTGSAQLRRRFDRRVTHCYLPYDTPGAVRRFFDRLQPCVGVIMETELWPNLLFTATARNIPVILANARLSERSARGYRRWSALTAQTLSQLAHAGAQTATDATRLRTLGLAAARVTVTGNIKFDAQRADPASGVALRQRLGRDRPVWLAASTHAGEEDAVLRAHTALRERHPTAALILAPRHPQRFDEVAQLCQKQGWATRRRSTDDHADCTVYLADTLGELPGLMAAADVVFVGGSLAPVGGHNLIEPAQQSKPILFGPHMHNFWELRSQVLTAGAGAEVMDADALATQLHTLISTASARDRMGRAASVLVSQHRGATARTLALLTPYLPG
ncbi:lipid IV(A) 3-deoxy-D-manno-octulosonic acid transferase [Immundisolibacter sp.]|uniref:lipid IV(A) 3-deoxy-D-manno-octulosonic acid transferase n=1 Tax=Immundisolibacter sp. TaxID=1934948 RepID=UPI003F84192B